MIPSSFINIPISCSVYAVHNVDGHNRPEKYYTVNDVKFDPSQYAFEAYDLNPS